MSYIEKEKLIKKDIASIENRVRHAFNQGYDLGFKNGKKSVKEPRKGHWIDNKCTNCGYEVQPWNTTNYCPNCGSNNREVEE